MKTRRGINIFLVVMLSFKTSSSNFLQEKLFATKFKMCIQFVYMN